MWFTDYNTIVFINNLSWENIHPQTGVFNFKSSHDSWNSAKAEGMIKVLT